MKSRGLPFKPDTMRALLNTHPGVWPAEPIDQSKPFKSQTRRLRGLGEINADPDHWRFEFKQDGAYYFFNLREGRQIAVRCPYGVPGNGIWAREALVKCQDSESSMPVVLYDVGRTPVLAHGMPGVTVRWEWKPQVLAAMYMPRWACRVETELMRMRLARVQDISENDAEAEGLQIWEDMFRDYSKPLAQAGWSRDPRYSYQTLWDSINAARGFSWDANPFVWALDLKRTK